MANKAVKIDAKLYAEIVRLIKKSEYRYRYNSISAFINETIYNRLVEGRRKNGFFKIKL